jgi:peptidoglycan hydrolase CwlO-like protein
MQMRKTLIILSIFAAVLLAKPLFVVAQAVSSGSTSVEIEALNKKISEKRKKIQQLEDSIVQVKKDIDKKRLEATSLKNQIAILDNRTTQIELDIEATAERLDSLNLEIQALELKIKLKEETITKQKEMLAEFIRTISYENDKDYLEVLAAYDNFSDFYTRLQYLNTIEEDLGQSAKSLRLAKVDLEEKKDQTTDRKDAYEKMKTELEEKKQNYNEQIFTKEDLLYKTKSSESTFQTLLSNLRKQYQEIEQEIANTERQVRERLEAQ